MIVRWTKILHSNNGSIPWNCRIIGYDFIDRRVQLCNVQCNGFQRLIPSRKSNINSEFWHPIPSVSHGSVGRDKSGTVRELFRDLNWDGPLNIGVSEPVAGTMKTNSLLCHTWVGGAMVGLPIGRVSADSLICQRIWILNQDHETLGTVRI